MTLKEEIIIDLPTPTGPMRTYILRPSVDRAFPALILYSEIFQVTGPIRRTAAQFASQGYVVAVPEVYHELEEPGVVLPYDQPGADRGNAHKYNKPLSAYDSDSHALIEHLKTRDDSTGTVGVVGICLGGHLAFRAAMHPAVHATACFYATDIHSASLGQGKQDDSLARAVEIKGELLHIWGRQDPHVPLEGRNRIKTKLDEVNANFQWLEVNGAHAFMRDEGYRYDPSLALLCFGMACDLFRRNL